MNPVNPTQVIDQPSSTSDTEKHLPHVAEEKLFQTKERAQMAEAQVDKLKESLDAVEEREQKWLAVLQ